MLILRLGETCQRDAQSKGKLWASWASCPYTFAMVITGPCLVLFLLESCFLLTLGISQHGVHYSVTSYSRKNFPFQETKWPSIFPLQKEAHLFILTQAAPAQTMPMYPQACTHTLQRQLISTHNLRHIFGFTVNPFMPEAETFVPLKPRDSAETIFMTANQNQNKCW